eukprot:CAMPEP_0183309838 /NCGR_PEP_ID=MMETSP0160_2-20130417/25567_1 /TAXON_ID=2839 ORGANISM="Odontella Sinensis, Strain Grunow 1884" /NCGR_SAMPLE_ID=MMETSP0160_2 /ASSEMBLY_ACC=CAM_ASM_000250 /LENGTH=559 /DNA_ID=CAMNT_0025473921 /DNA_START=107 /DNA_END=1786 /DNA_ORIENTATION=+
MALLSSLLRGGALAAVLFASNASAKRTGIRARAKAEFARAMNDAMKAEDKKRIRNEAMGRMRERVLSKAIPMPENVKDGMPDFLKVDTGAGFESKLPPQSRRQRQLEENGEEDEGREEWADFGWDPADYSIKYVGCANIAMYSDENAEGGSTVFETKRFVVFRLCPSYQCGNYYENGCSVNYGEYVISLDEYLEVFGQFKEEQFQCYCEYCEQCMYFENYFYGYRQLDDAGEDAAAGDDAAEAAGDDAVQEDADYYYVDEDAGDDAAQESHACKYYNECKDYLKICDYDQWYEAQGYDDDANKEDQDDDFEYREFFECQEVDDQYGYYAYYVAPTCSDDGKSIIFGIFDDAYCGNYIGDTVDVSEFTGLDLGEDVLADYAPEECLSCKESELPYMVIKNDQDDEDDIAELCENLYIESGKCNQHLYDGDDDAAYMGYNQAANSDAACEFAETVLAGGYDMNGMILIDEDEFSFDNISFGEFTDASMAQLAGIALVSLGIVAMTVWACFLHRALDIQAKTPDALLPASSELERRDSGIGMCRSTSRDVADDMGGDEHVLT